MPLPAALQAKLFKRGIVRSRSERNLSLFSGPFVTLKKGHIRPALTIQGSLITNNTYITHLEPEEEIIAENYDDQPSRNDQNEKGVSLPNSVSVTTPNIRIAPGCPNKWNIFHECTKFCFDRWGEGKRNPDPIDEKKRMKMVQRYPVPKNWDEIYDPGTGRYYYWNTLTDEVSWLPPLHPKAKVTLPASKLREMQKGKENSKPSEDVEMMDVTNNKNSDKAESSEAERNRSRRWDSRKNRTRIKHRFEQNQRDPRVKCDGDVLDFHFGSFEGYVTNEGGGGGRSVKKSNDLDPMDPASYSDIPRGTWSTGLERQGEAKTGADTTASGPLYQMRPYPSPGAVLRANAEIHKK